MATCIKIAQLEAFQDQLIITGYAYTATTAANSIKNECARVLPPPESLPEVANGACCYIANGGSTRNPIKPSKIYDNALKASKKEDSSVMGPTVQ
jgi:hypothetical protein